MKNCEQTKGQTIYEHGISVCLHLKNLISILENNNKNSEYPLPKWFFEYREQLLTNLLPWHILEEYTKMHDLGKPFCLKIDEGGKRHFPDHVKISSLIYRKIFKNEQVAKLIEMDMDIHLLKKENIEEFASKPEAVSLLLTGLAEVISNSQMFGGYVSTSFKIKFKHIEKRGSQILNIIHERY